MESFDISAGVVTENGAPGVLDAKKALFASAVWKMTANGGFVLVERDADARMKMRTFEEVVVRNDGSGYLGGLALGFCDLACRA